MEFDLLLVHAQIADVFRYRLFDGWIGIRDRRFITVEAGDAPAGIRATETLDLAGQIVMPGLIDSHLHIESSLLTPRRFAEAVLPFGTTTILSDPHEVGNVAGEDGVKWMIAASQDLPLKIYHSIPSCVPATSPEIEWTNEVFDAATIRRLARQPTVIALGEVMDYRGLLGPNERLQKIVRAAREYKLLIEGHIPTLAGIELSQYPRSRDQLRPHADLRGKDSGANLEGSGGHAANQVADAREYGDSCEFARSLAYHPHHR